MAVFQMSQELNLTSRWMKAAFVNLLQLDYYDLAIIMQHTM